MATSDKRSSYLTGAIGGLSPWNSRSTTPKPTQTTEGASDTTLQQQHGEDHMVTHWHKLSSKDYPPDCPPLHVRWYYAADIAKRKPHQLTQPGKEQKPSSTPKKYLPFSVKDSRAIETAFQTLVDEETNGKLSSKAFDDAQGDLGGLSAPHNRPNTNLDQFSEGNKEGRIKVPVNEDYLFDVDVERRELAPAYWLGPVYEVRRGSWFYADGLRPIDESLATQLEEGYLKVKPWNYSGEKTQHPSPQWRDKSNSLKPDDGQETGYIRGLTSKSSSSSLRADTKNIPYSKDTPHQQQLPTHRLFGTYMNSMVTYQDTSVAWLLSDDFYTRMSSTVYERFAGGGHLGGVKLIRGFTDPGKNKDQRDTKLSGARSPSGAGRLPEDDSKQSSTTDKIHKRRSAPPNLDSAKSLEQVASDVASEPNPHRQALERNISSFMSSGDPNNSERQEEEARKMEEKELEDDYQETEGEDQGRQIDHLILVTHGIGQQLGLRMEAVNFIHDVNVLRKNLKSVYSSSPDLQALNAEVGKLPYNCRVQVLPICWRHLLDFPKQSLRQNKTDYDLGDAEAFGEEDEYPSLSDITVEGVPALRALSKDLFLDILLYQSNSYRKHIAGIVQRECNRIYKLFRERNKENFNGKVSLIGHSLGSAIFFDLLCWQDDERSATNPGHGRYTHKRPSNSHSKGKEDVVLDFDVDNLFCLGSPIGLFQMLKGRRIAARQPPGKKGQSHLDPADDPFLGDPLSSAAENISRTLSSPFVLSSPKCSQLFNIFHPAGPISYRIEPLISPAMASLKPQPLPYTRKGIFGAPVGQGLTGIGARVGQSVSGLWSSLSASIASNILQKSLGYTGEEGKESLSSVSRAGAAPTHGHKQSLSIGAGTNISGGGVIGQDTSLPFHEHANLPNEKKKQEVAQAALGTTGSNNETVTLVNTEIETLYNGFQKRRRSQQSDGNGDLEASAEWREEEERAKRLRREEAKVRALNSTGRVDFSIQEGVFDISIIASIASHLSYWGDADTASFMLSQLLVGHRTNQRKKDVDELRI